MNIPPIQTTSAAARVVRTEYDFNTPPDGRGFYHTLVDEPVVVGDTVVLDGWLDGGPRLRCRVHAVIAICEPIGEFESPDEGGAA